MRRPNSGREGVHRSLPESHNLKATTALPLLENLSGQYNSPDSLLPRLARVNQGINDKGLRLPFISRTRHIPQYEGVRIGKRVQQDESPQKSALVRRQYHDAIGVMGTPGFGLMGIAAWPSTRYQKKTKAQEARAEIRADVEKQIKALASKRAAAQANILELRQHTEDRKTTEDGRYLEGFENRRGKDLERYARSA